jgi:outer membrane protein assembly factor BamB
MQCNRSFVDPSPALSFNPVHTSSARQGSFTLTLLLLLLSACLLCSTVVKAEEIPTTTPAITINPTVGPPTTNMLVSGTGFDPNVAVDIYFDKTDLALATTNGAGAFGRGSVFGGIALQVPASALPGTHWITARERYRIKAAQKPFLVRTDWAEWHYDPTRTGANPYENVLSPATVGNLNLRRIYPLASNPLPVLVGGVLYVVGFDYNNGGKDLYALDAGSGDLLWYYNVGGPRSVISAPAVANGVVYVGSDDGNLYALNANTGVLLWNYTRGIAGLYSSPAVVNGVMYTTFSQYPRIVGVLAFNASTGAFLWGWGHGSDGTALADPVVVEGGVVEAIIGPHHECDTYCYFVLWLDASSGAERGRYYLSYPEPTGASLAAGYFTFASTLYGPGWQYDTGTIIASAPVVANGVVYVGSDNTYALDAGTGTLRWQSTIVGSDYAVANGVLYVSGGSIFYALDASTGAILWKYTTGSWINSSPVVANGTVYVGSADGNLYAFGLPSDQMSKEFKSPARPDPTLLVPNWTLKPSTPVTTMPRH